MINSFPKRLTSPNLPFLSRASLARFALKRVRHLPPNVVIPLGNGSVAWCPPPNSWCRLHNSHSHSNYWCMLDTDFSSFILSLLRPLCYCCQTIRAWTLQSICLLPCTSSCTSTSLIIFMCSGGYQQHIHNIPICVITLQPCCASISGLGGLQFCLLDKNIHVCVLSLAKHSLRGY
jgi:hypothetical protein